MGKRLPVGIQDFRTIIEEGYLYVDKTESIYNFIQSGRIYFLSRPRRFGKTLLVSVLECLFKGERDLFKGLWIEDKWDWNETYPVIRLDMSSINIHTKEEVRPKIINRIKDIAQVKEISGINEIDHAEAFRSLIHLLCQKHNKKAVILIDEYDSPIISNLNNIENAKQIRDEIRDFYRVLKSEEASLRFIFLTGVSKFSKAGVFSALNNLADITLDARFATMLGVTQVELESYFEDYITELAESEGINRDELIEKIKWWYNGFCFDGKNGAKETNLVYNPFSTLLFFSQQAFQHYWFATGSPKFLIDLLKQNNYPISNLENKIIKLSRIDSYEPENLNILALLFQTGYLTIKGSIDKETVLLSYPNYEVESVFLEEISVNYIGQIAADNIGEAILKTAMYLKQGNIDGFIEILEGIYADIPYDITDKIKDKEQYYQTAGYLVLKLLGLKAGAEVRSNKGRIDLVVEVEDKVYIIELKINGREDAALEQITSCGYAQRYQGSGKAVYLVGIGFDVNKRNISGYKAVMA